MKTERRRKVSDQPKSKHGCPSGTQCRICPHYSFNAKMGYKNTQGSATEVGNCNSRKGYTYAEWFGWLNHNGSSQLILPNG
ncbi:hypothetical protein [Roseivirga seohaensis]|uniref:hypothetical protein n=1 Tax=Roseivirga seohaensis TaxID=1914963 RepID=UPI003BA88799